MTALAPAAPATGVRLPALLRHSLALAWRSLVKTTRTPEALIDVTVQPIVFLLLFTYVFGGAIAGGARHAYLQFLVPGMLGQSIALGGIAVGVNLNGDIDRGVFDRFRSLPIGRAAPLVGAVLADVVRYLVLCVCLLGVALLAATTSRGERVQTVTRRTSDTAVSRVRGRDATGR